MNSPGRRTHAALLLLSSFVPAWMAAAHASSAVDAAHDEGAIRALGLGWTGAFRSLDAIVGGLFMAVPIGTRAARAGLATACLCGVAAGLLYYVTRRLLAACAD